MAARTASKAETLNQTIAERAHQLFLTRGGEHGYDLEDWLAAEAEVKAVSARKRTTTTARKPKAAAKA